MILPRIKGEFSCWALSVFTFIPWNVSWAPGNSPRARAVMDKTLQKLRAGGAALTCSDPWGRNPHDHIPNPVSRSQTSVRAAFPRVGHCGDFISERIPCLGLGVQGNAKGIPWRPRYPLGSPDPGIPNKPGLVWAGAPLLRAGTLWPGPRGCFGTPTHSCSILQLHEVLWDLNPQSCTPLAAPAGQRREFSPNNPNLSF